VFSVVIATPDVVGERMAGPGIRAFHLAEELGKHFPTTLMSQGNWSRTKMREASVLIGQPARGFHRMRRGQKVIYDLFDPILLELREMYGRRPSLRQRLHFVAEQMRLQQALSQGDLFMVATPHQRELYAGKPMIEVPFGTELGVVDSGEEQENLILWGGGTWEWLDPRTAVDAVVRVNRRTRVPAVSRFRDQSSAGRSPSGSRFDELIGRQSARDREPVWVHRDHSKAYKVAMMHRQRRGHYSSGHVWRCHRRATPVIATEGLRGGALARRDSGSWCLPGMSRGRCRDRAARDDAFHASCVHNPERIRPRLCLRSRARWLRL
jgi:hypothetical protein